MTKATKFAALKQGDDIEFWGNDLPKCPHCGHLYDINDHEAWGLYEEGPHEIECPSCDLEYDVTVNVSCTYSTDEQEDDE